jgi:hypothetical protein
MAEVGTAMWSPASVRQMNQDCRPQDHKTAQHQSDAREGDAADRRTRTALNGRSAKCENASHNGCQAQSCLHRQDAPEEPTRNVSRNERAEQTAPKQKQPCPAGQPIGHLCRDVQPRAHHPLVARTKHRPRRLCRRDGPLVTIPPTVTAGNMGIGIPPGPGRSAGWRIRLKWRSHALMQAQLAGPHRSEMTVARERSHTFAARSC